MDPSPETLANREAGRKLMADAARKGNKLALETEALEGLANASGMYIMPQVDQADEEDDWDDCRPY